MGESWRTRLYRYGFNLFPAYRSTGGWLTHVEDDWSEVRVRIPLSWRTRNYHGTTFGGTLYGAVDPLYAMMLIKRLGSAYEVWDKAASISFRRPGEGTLYATCRLPAAEVAATREAVEAEGVTDRHYDIEIVDSEGAVHATVEKTVHVRRADGD